MYKPTGAEIVIHCLSAEFSDKYERLETTKATICQEALELLEQHVGEHREQWICSKASKFIHTNMSIMGWLDNDIDGITWFTGMYAHAIIKSGMNECFKKSSFIYIARACMCTYFNIDYTTTPTIISKEEFLQIKERSPQTQTLLQSIGFKKCIQTSIFPFITNSEREDIRNCHRNEQVIERLCQLGFCCYAHSPNHASLYACAIAIATIIKEYDWGTEYLATDGLYNLATRIQGYEITL